MLRKAFGDGPPDPDDISQLAFQKVIERGDIASIENLRAFLWRTARNLVLNEKRREDVRSRHDYEIEQLFFATEGDASSAERVISAREQLSLVNALLEKMPENRRRAFYLHRVEGLTVAEVGRRLGISRTGAAKHIARAISDIDGFFADNAEKDR